MQPKKHKRDIKPDMEEPGVGIQADPARAAFTSAIVAALQELEHRKPPSPNDLGRQAYQKLQYDLPLVTEEELAGLTHTLRCSLQMKCGEPSFPLTHKLLENIVAGARGPLAAARPAPRPAGPQDAPETAPSAAMDAPGGPPATSGIPVAAGAAQPASATAALDSSSQPSYEGGQVAPVAAPDAAAGAPASQQSGDAAAPSPLPPPPLPSSLLQADPLGAHRQGLSGAYRSLCATVFVQLVAHCLTVSEQDTWVMLHEIVSDGAEVEAEQEQEERQGGDGLGDAEAEEQRQQHSNGCRRSGEDPNGGSARSGSGGYEDGSGAEKAIGLPTNEGAASSGEAGQVPDASTSLATLALAGGEEADLRGQQLGQRQQQPAGGYEAPMAEEEDGDDFVFEDLEASGPNNRSAPTAAGPPAVSASTAPPPPYAWPALRRRLLLLASHVSYALLDDPALWRDGELLQGVFQLLRALGAHRHAQELQPLLHAYVGLVADRLAAAPEELGFLDSLWDAVGVSCIASLPQQVGRQRATVTNGSGRRDSSAPVLLAEASTCLSLVASLAGQLTAPSARLRLWQQVHKHMLPLLERCLGELARGVGQVAAGSRGAGGRAQAAGAPGAAESAVDGKGPGPEEVAAIVLVCQVLDFYVQQRPGNADLASALKGTGVLASLSVLFAAAAALPGAEPLRSAALCCAASHRELHAWMVAVPGVAQAVKGPCYQEDGPYEAHGAVWELLASNGSSPLALSILAGGATPEKAVRVHALLQLLGKAAACRGGRGGALWAPPVERALRELFAALREEQAAGAGARGGAVAAPGQVPGQNGVCNRSPGGTPGSGRMEDGVSSGTGVEAEAGAEEEDDEEKLRMLDPAALQRRRARQLHPACWRILKELLTTGGEFSGKTD